MSDQAKIDPVRCPTCHGSGYVVDEVHQAELIKARAETLGEVVRLLDANGFHTSATHIRQLLPMLAAPQPTARDWRDVRLSEFTAGELAEVLNYDECQRQVFEAIATTKVGRR